MGIISLIVLAIGLSMDAFAVAICKGLGMEKVTFKKMMIVGAWFGIFQAIMPFLGYLLGKNFQSLIEKYDHWIAFTLLVLLGINMIKESFSKEETNANGSLSFKSMLVLAIATSIDALAAGITFGVLETNIYVAISLISVITFFISSIGVKIGNVFGLKYKSKAEIAGGIILILLGIKILLEHMFSIMLF